MSRQEMRQKSPLLLFFYSYAATIILANAITILTKDTSQADSKPFTLGRHAVMYVSAANCEGGARTRRNVASLQDVCHVVYVGGAAAGYGDCR